MPDLAEALARIAGALADARLGDLSAECERLAAAEKERRRRAKALDALLPTLAEALDVREVFQKVCAVAREVVPFDLLELGLLNEERTHARVYAVSDSEEPVGEPEFQLPDIVRSSVLEDFTIFRDAEIDPETGRARVTLHSSESPAEQTVEITLPVKRIQKHAAIGVRS